MTMRSNSGLRLPEEAGTRLSVSPSLLAAILLALPLLLLPVSLRASSGQRSSGAAGAASPSLTQELRAVVQLLDWDLNNNLPPWMSSIAEGSSKGVAVLLGQSLKPDGSVPEVMTERAEVAKCLLEEGKVAKVIVSGSDPAGVGRTEASELAAILVEHGIQRDSIIQESQSTTTAENAWFSLRWIPKGTGQLYIVTSDFHMARATYIFQETFNHFYALMERSYRKDPLWTNRKRYPRLKLHQAVARSFCGSNASLNKDSDPNADINSQSLARRATDELRFLGSHEVEEDFYGEPRSRVMYIWPVPIDVRQDPKNRENYRRAMAQAMTVAEKLCRCQAPPERGGPRLPYPLTLPIPTNNTTPLEQWTRIVNTCKASESCPVATPVGECSFSSCAEDLGPATCVGGECLCQPGYCRYPVTEIHLQMRRCRALIPGTSCGWLSPCIKSGLMRSSCVEGVCMCRSLMHLGADGTCHEGWSPDEEAGTEAEASAATNATQRAQALTARFGGILDTSEEDREAARNVASAAALVSLPFLLLSGAGALLRRRWQCSTSSAESAGATDYREMPEGEVAAAVFT